MLERFSNNKCLLKQIYLQFAIDIFGIDVLNRESNHELRDSFLLELDFLVRKYDIFLTFSYDELRVLVAEFLLSYDC